MRSNLLKIISSFCVLLALTPADATQVPFQNVPLNQGISLQASYSFGNFSVIFCFDNSTDINSDISWPYKGAVHFSRVPVLLKTKSNFQGYFADSHGTITIKNTTKTQLEYSCVFGY